MNDTGLKRQMLRDLEVLGRRQLKGFEIIKALHLVLEPFSAENGLATPTMKVVRSAARNRFRDEIRAMYQTLAQQQADAAK